MSTRGDKPDKPENKSSLNKGTSTHRHHTKSPIRRSRSNETENRRHEGSRGRQHDRNEHSRRHRGRSEEGRSRRNHNEPEPQKTEQPRDDLQDTECIVCFCNFDNVFKTPKLLSCGHTFCLECLARINVTSPEVKTLSCPICREVTEIPHGRDLPHLLNNEDIFRKLPGEMQRALSIRFKRSKGKLVLKNPPPSNSIKSSLNLPALKKKKVEQAGSNSLGIMEEGFGQATMINVGRPPSRMRGRMRRLMYSNHCYYAVVAAIVTITIALMLVGIFSFVVSPYIHKPIKPSVNQTIDNSFP
ncbi:hypothetical protein DNTS_009597 [Danionella cerebrum]|uniref:RING-type domain-containing protein n=1 Tax=Danionella cerebrum TaxID=2873325 RepID=A0A553R3G6_9TELE|nr:hypothetical protein DNTS_009597 [Danionella translucida]